MTTNEIPTSRIAVEAVRSGDTLMLGGGVGADITVEKITRLSDDSVVLRYNGHRDFFPRNYKVVLVG